MLQTVYSLYELFILLRKLLVLVLKNPGSILVMTCFLSRRPITAWHRTPPNFRGASRT